MVKLDLQSKVKPYQRLLFLEVRSIIYNYQLGMNT